MALEKKGKVIHTGLPRNLKMRLFTESRVQLGMIFYATLTGIESCEVKIIQIVSNLWLSFSLSLSAKDDSKSPIRASERISVTAPPSRKASAVSNVSTIAPNFSQKYST